MGITGMLKHIQRHICAGLSGTMFTVCFWIVVLLYETILY